MTVEDRIQAEKEINMKVSDGQGLLGETGNSKVIKMKIILRV